MTHEKPREEIKVTGDDIRQYVTINHMRTGGASDPDSPYGRVERWLLDLAKR
jgi:hypothetical protein